MSLNSQTPYFFTALNSSSNVVTVTNARAVSILTSGGVTDVVNTSGQTLSIPDGSTLTIEADSGNTLSDIVITPNSGATAFVCVLGGNGSVA